MKNMTKVARYVLVAVIVVILGVFAGWYFYISSKQTAVTQVDAARGLSAPVAASLGAGVDANPNGGTVGSYGQNALSPAQSAYTASSSPLWLIEPNPVAGFGFLTASSTPQVEYVLRSSGYLITADLGGRTTVRITTNLIPKIYEAMVAQDGSAVMRSIDASGTVTTLLGATKSATTSDSLVPVTTFVGKYITPDIRHLTLNPVSKMITYSTDAISGESITSASWDGKKHTSVFSSPIGNWSITALSDGRTYLTEAPADGIVGYTYRIANGSLIPVASGPGLTILPQENTTAMLLSTSQNGNLSLAGYPKTGAAAVAIPLHTITEKCVWLKSKAPIAYCAVPENSGIMNFLDGWYSGALHTNDSWWEVDVSTGNVQEIYTASANGPALDVKSPQVDDSGNYIVFINNTDGSLWALRIAQ